MYNVGRAGQRYFLGFLKTGLARYFLMMSLAILLDQRKCPTIIGTAAALRYHIFSIFSSSIFAQFTLLFDCYILVIRDTHVDQETSFTPKVFNKDVRAISLYGPSVRIAKSQRMITVSSSTAGGAVVIPGGGSLDLVAIAYFSMHISTCSIMAIGSKTEHPEIRWSTVSVNLSLKLHLASASFLRIFT